MGDPWKTKRPRIDVSEGGAIPRKTDRGLFTAWRVAFIGSVAAVVGLVAFKPDPYRTILAFLPDGILITFKVTVLSIIFSMILGLIAGLGRISKNRIINGIASLYVEVIRGIPLLVQLFYIYYALGRVIRLEDITCAVIAMSICYGAYIAEIIRAGIEAVPDGQTEAARSLGMTPYQTNSAPGRQNHSASRGQRNRGPS